MKKLVSFAILLLFAWALLAYSFNIFPVSGAFTTIYIRANGMIDPPTAPIQRDGNVYRFVSDINGSIVIERDNIVVDGQDYSLVGIEDFESKAFNLTGRTNVTIQNVRISRFYFGVWLYYSNRNVIVGNFATDNIGRCVWLGYSNNNSVIVNNFTENKGRGILLDHSHNNTIMQNRIVDNDCDAMIIDHSDGNVIVGNVATGHIGHGVWLGYSNNNSIVENNFTENNYDGIGLYFSNGNDIRRNTVTMNNYHGIQLRYSPNNTICNNNFVNNTIQAYIYPSLENTWDNGYPFGGNFWSDHDLTDEYGGVNQNVTGSDGVSDAPYFVDVNNVDEYPFRGVFYSFNVSLGCGVYVVSNSIIEDFQYFESDGSIRIFASSLIANQTDGFCRLAIPHDVVSPPYNVTVNGNSVDYSIIFDNGTMSIIYFGYDYSVVGIIVIPEFPLFYFLLFAFAIFSAIHVLLGRVRFMRNEG
ncbi:right-handed parallel beta-helix repeat-containing protein [Candidatus Bathyarchaeota archaeon]|nr:right-handed parallel beta-helix repeat-containing protein [Candidatus Bathyarchaeota archaeon]